MQQTERLSALTERYRELGATTDAARYLMLKAQLGTSDDATAVAYFAQRYPRSSWVLEHKAAVPPVGIGSGGDALLPPSTDPIIAVIQRESLPARMALRKVPFGVPVPVQSSLGNYYWVGQGQSKPVSRIDWDAVTNPFAKFAGIVPVTRELVKLAGAEGVFTAALTGGAVQFYDAQFLDPAVAMVANKNPASITNGVTPITATGTTLADQVRELLAALFAGRPETQRPVLIATPAVATALAAGESSLTVAGGTFSGVPVYPSPGAGSLVIAVDANGVIYSDDGGEVDMSEDATVAVDDAPTGATTLTSFWQTNHVGFRVERMVWYQKLEANVVRTLAVA